ncbi:translation initiation factor IF-2 [Plasmodium sp. DRC-Itaito]|nr:translation initiation factor IF-2 [Plasmodium sp. DRC-Itaito]
MFQVWHLYKTLFFIFYILSLQQYVCHSSNHVKSINRCFIPFISEYMYKQKNRKNNKSYDYNNSQYCNRITPCDNYNKQLKYKINIFRHFYYNKENEYNTISSINKLNFDNIQIDNTIYKLKKKYYKVRKVREKINTLKSKGEESLISETNNKNDSSVKVKGRKKKKNISNDENVMNPNNKSESNINLKQNDSSYNNNNNNSYNDKHMDHIITQKKNKMNNNIDGKHNINNTLNEINKEENSSNKDDNNKKRKENNNSNNNNITKKYIKSDHSSYNNINTKSSEYEKNVSSLDEKYIGKTFEGYVYSVNKNAACIKLQTINKYGLLFKNKANLGDDIEDMNDFFEKDQTVHVKILGMNTKKNIYYLGNIIKYNENIKLNKGEYSKGLITKVCDSYCFIKVLKNGSSGYLHKSKLFCINDIEKQKSDNSNNNYNTSQLYNNDNLQTNLIYKLQFTKIFNIWDIIDVEILGTPQNDYKSNYILTIPTGSKTFKKIFNYLNMLKENEDINDIQYKGDYIYPIDNNKNENIIDPIIDNHDNNTNKKKKKNLYDLQNNINHSPFNNFHAEDEYLFNEHVQEKFHTSYEKNKKYKNIYDKENNHKINKSYYLKKNKELPFNNKFKKIIKNVYDLPHTITLSMLSKTIKIPLASIKKYFVIHENKEYNSSYKINSEQIKRICEHFKIDCNIEQGDDNVLTLDNETTTNFQEKIIKNVRQDVMNEREEEQAIKVEEKIKNDERVRQEQKGNEEKHMDEKDMDEKDMDKKYMDEKDMDKKYMDVKNMDVKNVDVKNVDVKNVDVKNVDVKNVDVKNVDVKNVDAQNINNDITLTKSIICQTDESKDAPVGDQNESLDEKTYMEKSKEKKKKKEKGKSRKKNKDTTLTLKSGSIEKSKSTLDDKKRNVVVTFIGHINHGKTSLFDYICKTNEQKKEYGLITQNIRAFKATVRNNFTFTLVDTPGHEAFMPMRSRGVKISDLSILVISGEEGIQEQTVECIKLIKEFNIKIIIAITKVDMPNVDVDRIINDLLYHDITTELNGGEIQVVECSIYKEESIDKLLDAIYLESEFLNLQMNPDNKPEQAQGVVLDSYIDKNGIVSINLLQNGVLNINDYFYTGSSYGKVKILKDHLNKNIKTAYPSDPIKIIGYNKNSVPVAGDKFYVVENETLAKEIAEHNKNKMLTMEINNFSYDEMNMDKYKDFIISRENKIGASANTLGENNIKNDIDGNMTSDDNDSSDNDLNDNDSSDNHSSDNHSSDNHSSYNHSSDNYSSDDDITSDDNIKEMEKYKNNKSFPKDDFLKINLNNTNKNMIEIDPSTHIIDNEIKNIYSNYIIKCDKQGSIEILKNCMLKLQKEDSIYKIKNKIIYADIGNVTSSDIKYATSFNATIIAFGVKLSNDIKGSKNSKGSKNHNNYPIIYSNVLYELIENIEKEMEKKLSKKPMGELKGRAQILKVFNISKIGKVAGCIVKKGTININSNIRILRNDKVIYMGKILSIKIIKEEKTQVTEGDECGMGFQNFLDFEPNDIIESYEN